jgi:hypothetical protein
MRNALLVSHGYLGDNLFISSVAEKLKKEHQYDTVDFITGFPQVYELLKQNPHIDNVYATEIATPYVSQLIHEYDLSIYEKVFTFSPFSFKIPPATEAQLQSGITNPTPDFRVWTVPEYDHRAKEFIVQLKQERPNAKVIGWMRNWKQKAFSFTEQQYWNASDHPLTGYGKENRNIDYIIDELSKHFIMVPIGVPESLSQFDTAQHQKTYRTFAEDASILKFCDYFIGTEGGLANLACGVGCKTLLTYEFIWQCYGPRGTVRPFENGPPLGPVYYFNGGHEYLPLYKTDEELVQLFIEKLKHD